MVVKTRSSNGRFTPSPNKTSDDILDAAIPINIQKETMVKIIKYIFLLLLISPWLLLAFRKHTVENISRNIIDFYDDNFSCNSYCSTMSSPPNVTTTEKKQSGF